MIKSIAKVPGFVFFTIRRVYRKILKIILRPHFKECGNNVQFSPENSVFSYSSISIGSDVQIGTGATFIAAVSSISIGNKVMFGPNVSIRGGNHNTSVVGKYMYDVKEKRPEDDEPVVIEDDVWIGTDVVILKGVTIGRGSIIAAGAVVTKSVPPYSIAGGVPAKILRKRWDEEQIINHEKILYGKVITNFE